jgi:tetratricopeptide (TPR) repeat protein
LDAATNVCGGAGLGEIDILDLLGSLSDKSLVVVDTSGEQERYRLLESTAAYALEKLSASGERDSLARRHAEYFRDGALAADERYGSGSTSAWLSGVELELGNHRTALVWALTQGNDAVVGAALAGALHRLWTNASLAVEGRYWIGLALERVSEAEQPLIAARLWLALSYLSSGDRSYEAAQHSLQLYRSQGDVRGAARAQTSVAFSLYFLDRFEEAGAVSEQALAAWYELGDEYETALSLVIRAAVEETRGQYRLGRELYTRALATFKSLGDRIGEGIALINLAELESADGHPDEALRLVNEALEIVSHEKNAAHIATALSNRAGYHIALGNLEGARESESEGLHYARQAQNERLLVNSLERMALLAALQGDAPRAARLLGYVDSELSRTRQTPDKGLDEKLRAALREALSEDEIRSLATEGAAWSEDHAVEEALKA